MKRLNTFIIITLFLFFAVVGNQVYGFQENSSMSFLVTGDALISLPLSSHSEPEFMQLIHEIRSVDVAITNLEMLIHTYKGFPQAESGGTYMIADPEIARELVWAGFDMAACANNHTYDYGVTGILETDMYLKEAGLAHAGFGMDLQEAQKPCYLRTEKGKIALLSCASTFTDFGRAGRSRPDLHGRPGLNPLSVNRTYTSDKTTAEKLQQCARENGIPEGTLTEDRFRFMDRTYSLGDSYGEHYRVDERDFREIINAVREARKNADWVVMSIHAHQGGNGVPDFLMNFAHACIDNGADIVFGHGPHYLKGIEIYKGKPVFYNLGNFIFQNETIKKQPSEFYERYGLGDTATPDEAYSVRTQNDTRSWPVNPIYWESAVPKIVFRKGVLEEIRLLPITLLFGKPRGVRGRPLMADKELGKKIVEKLKELSEPFGTEIEYVDNVGLIKMKK